LHIYSFNSFSSSELFDSDDDFPSSYSPDALTSYKNEFSLLEEHSETFSKNQKPVSPTAHSRSSSNRKILSELNRESLDSSSDISSKLPKRLTKKIKGTPSEEKMEQSLLKLTSVVSSHLENKPQNISYNNVTDEDEIFAKAVACQLKKILEPEKSQLKGQIMKILYNL